MNIKQYLFIGLSLLGLASCSENDDNNFNSAEWKAKNEAYFEQQYQAHSVQSATSFILPSWPQASSKSLSEVEHTKCILVDVLEEGPVGGDCPQYTDTVQVHYSGRLIPTDDYPNGYIFDKSYLSTLDPDVDVPGTFGLSGTILEGFSTAVQHMHRGDHWRVIVPYDLGYGANDNGVIPAYSTLIFELRLVDFWYEEEGDRD